MLDYEAVVPRAIWRPPQSQWARGAALVAGAAALAAAVCFTTRISVGSGRAILAQQQALYQSGADSRDAEEKRLTYLHDPFAARGIIGALSKVIEAAPDEKAYDPARRPLLLISGDKSLAVSNFMSGEKAESVAMPLRPGGLGVWLNRGDKPEHNVWSLDYLDDRTNAHYGAAADTHHEWNQNGVIAPDKDIPHSMYYNMFDHEIMIDPMATNQATNQTATNQTA
jgi:hypothetical protein